MYYVVAGRHAALGYVDQPPLTPLLSAAAVALLGVTPTAVRVLPALEMALVVVLVALIARDLGGSRRAQILAPNLAGRPRMGGRRSRWPGRSLGMPLRTAPRSCRCCGSSAGLCSSR